jgi:hypothetical protein
MPAQKQSLSIKVISKGTFAIDPAVGILLPHLLELTAAHLVRLDPLLTARLPPARPYSRLASFISAWRVQSS